MYHNKRRTNCVLLQKVLIRTKMNHNFIKGSGTKYLLLAEPVGSIPQVATQTNKTKALHSYIVGETQQKMKQKSY